jgi:hypothetical protein
MNVVERRHAKTHHTDTGLSVWASMKAAIPAISTWFCRTSYELSCEVSLRSSGPGAGRIAVYLYGDVHNAPKVT